MYYKNHIVIIKREKCFLKIIHDLIPPNITKIIAFWRISSYFFLCFEDFLKMFIYFWEREKVRSGEERGRHRIWSRLHVLSCQHRAQGSAWTHKLWDHDLSWSRTLNHLTNWAIQVLLKKNCFLSNWPNYL